MDSRPVHSPLKHRGQMSNIGVQPPAGAGPEDVSYIACARCG